MPRVLSAVVFLSVLLTVTVGGHLYVARRLVIDSAPASPWRELGLAAIALLGATLFLQPIGERLLRPPLSRALAWPASVWMGLFFFLLVLAGASDLLLALLGAAGVSDAGDPTAARARALAVVGLAGAAGVAGLRGGLRAPALRRIEIVLPRWPPALDGFRVVQISDIHIGPILGRRFAQRLVARCNALEADLVAVTGDLVDGSVRTLSAEVAPFAGLRARHGVFFVTGNHDFYSGVEAWARKVAELGLRALRNERVRIEARGAAFELAGVDDHRGDLVRPTEDLERALAGRDPSLPVVLLAHDPSTWKRARRAGVDLQISGHTHGGQIWPFVLLVKLVVPFVAGLYRDGDARLYVSRGTGFWGPPMRLFAPAEVSELVLRAPPGETPAAPPQSNCALTRSPP